MRERMRDCVIDNAFISKFEALGNRLDEVSEKLYIDIYGNHLDTMHKLPNGFFRSSSHLYIAIGGQEHRLTFLDCRLTAYGHDKWNKAKYYVGDEPLAKEFMQVAVAIEKLEAERTKMSREVFALLDSVQTFKKLWEIWPESKSLLSKFEEKPAIAMLPAIEVQKINDALGLTVEAV